MHLQRFWIFILVLICTGLFFEKLHLGLQSPGIDYYQFWVGGQVLQEKKGLELYTSAGRDTLGKEYYWRAQNSGSQLQLGAAQVRQRLETYGSPSLYSVFELISTGQYQNDHARFIGLSLVFYLGGTSLLLWTAGFSFSEGLVLLLFFLTLWEPLLSDLRVGNVNQVQLGFLGMLVFFLGKKTNISESAAGLVLGFLLLFKPNLFFVPILLFFSWFIQKLWLKSLRVGLGTGVALFIGLGLSFADFGSSSCWSEWSKTLADLMSIAPLELGNLALTEAFQYAVGFKLPVYVFVPVFLFPTLFALLKTQPVSDFFLLTLGLGMGLVTTPLVWLHYNILMIPLLLYLIQIGLKTQNVRFGIFVSLLAGLLSYIPTLLFSLFLPGPAPVYFLQALASIVLFSLTLTTVFLPKLET